MSAIRQAARRVAIAVLAAAGVGGASAQDAAQLNVICSVQAEW